MCGASGDVTLEVHHIVPVLSGGVSHGDLLITLCTGCHNTAEAYTRKIPEFEAVLTE